MAYDMCLTPSLILIFLLLLTLPTLIIIMITILLTMNSQIIYSSTIVQAVLRSLRTSNQISKKNKQELHYLPFLDSFMS